MQLKLSIEPTPEGRPEVSPQQYQLMLECFLSEQMTLGQLFEHMQDGNAFRDFVLKHLSEIGD